MKIRKIGFILVGIVLGFAGCSSTIQPEKIDLAREWANKLAPYRLTPLFPPRDTIEVGDVYLVCEPGKDHAAEGEQFPPKFMTPLVGFQKAMQAFSSSRLELPKQTSADSGKSSVIDVPQSASGISAPGKWTHLGLASFPTVFQVEGSTVDASASLPTGFAIFGLGGKKQTASTYILSVPAAEYEGLDVLTADATAESSLQCLSPAKRQALLDHLTAAQKTYGSCVRLVYVRELYLARHMTLSYGVDRQSALEAQAKLYIDPTSARGHVEAALAKAASTPQAASAASAAPASNASVDERLNYVETTLDKTIATQQAMLSSQVAGGQISAAAVSEGGISFDYSFSTPVAIGATLQHIDIDSAPVAVAPGAGAAAAEPTPCPEPLYAVQVASQDPAQLTGPQPAAKKGTRAPHATPAHKIPAHTTPARATPASAPAVGTASVADKHGPQFKPGLSDGQGIVLLGKSPKVDIK